MKLRLIDAECFECIGFHTTGEQRYDDGFADGVMFISEMIDSAPTINAIPIEWLNERHRKCCEEADTDLMDAITVLCNEYHVWQKKQENQND